jgi:hypothetical protein
MAGGFDPNSFQQSQFQTSGPPPPPPTPPPPLLASDDSISGITRSGISRSDSWPIQNWLLARIAGVTYDATRLTIQPKSIAITDNQNATSDTCSFVMTGNPPLEGTQIILAAATFAKRLFGGAVQKLTQYPMKPGNPQVWRVECMDWWWFANRRQVFANYLTLPGDVIFKDIVSRFTSGFTFNNVLAAPNITGGISFNGEYVLTALSRLCERIGWDCYIDPWKDFHFFDIESVRAKALEPGRYHYWELQYTRDLSQIRNRVYQIGGGGVTTAQVLAGALAIPIDVMTWYPTAGPNMRVEHGGQIIPYTGITGNNLNVAAGVIDHTIPQGDEIGIMIQVDDVASQMEMAVREGEDSDGIHEFHATSDRRLAETAAITKATAELNAWNSAAIAGSYHCYDDDARSGRSVDIILPYRGSTLAAGGRYAITSVTTAVRAGKRRFEKTVNFGNTDKLDIFTALRGGVI